MGECSELIGANACVQRDRTPSVSRSDASGVGPRLAGY